MKTDPQKVSNQVRTRRSSREAILDAAELLMSKRGYNGVSIREIAGEASANLGSVTYHFGTKENLLAEIYERHCPPMNQRRMELLREAERISNREECISAIVRSYIIPAFSSRSEEAGGGSQFTRVRAILAIEGNETARQIIAKNFDETNRAFVDAIARRIPEAPRESIVWRCHFLLGSLYYTLVNSERISRMTVGTVDGTDFHAAMEELVRATTASFIELEKGAPQKMN
ncbi:MAG: TetR family transcriptional regulator [SAR324 cluster bacterium]|nr:TetR family transcriptional regulator [SAR324 cluster bacterium]